MPDNELSLREAGARISSSGLTEDVRQPTTRGASQLRKEGNDTSRDARRNAKDRRQERREVQDDHDYGDGDTFGGEEEEEGLDDDADGSNRDDDGDTDNGEETEGDEGQSEEGEDDEGEEADEDKPAKEAKHTVKVNGKTFEVPTSELIAGYQRNVDYQNKTRHVAERNRQLTASHTQVAQDYTKRLSQVNAVMTGVRKLLAGDVNSQEMRELQRSNPGEWAVQRQLFADRIHTIDTVIQTLVNEHERHATEFTETQKRNANALIGQAREALTKEIPDWEGEGNKRLAVYLTRAAGFNMAEINAVTDARMLIVADKARRWDAYQAAKRQAAKPKLKQTPKHVKPGKTSITRNSEAPARGKAAFRSARDKARKSGDMRDAGRAITHLLK